MTDFSAEFSSGFSSDFSSDIPSNFPYKDILHCSRPISTKHQSMSMAGRAAQFSPFAALTGHGKALEETLKKSQLRVENEIERKKESCPKDFFT